MESTSNLLSDEERKQMQILGHWYANRKEDAKFLPRLKIVAPATDRGKQTVITTSNGGTVYKDKKLKRIEEIHEALFFDCVVLVRPYLRMANAVTNPTLTMLRCSKSTRTRCRAKYM